MNGVGVGLGLNSGGKTRMADFSCTNPPRHSLECGLKEPRAMADVWTTRHDSGCPRRDPVVR